MLDVRVELSRVDGRAAAGLLEASYSGVPVTRRERYTLLAAGRVFDVLRVTSFHEDVTSVLAKFEQPMNATERKEHGALGQHFAYVPEGGTKAYEGKEDLIDALQIGILSRKIVRFSYKDSRGRARSGDLAPFVILMYRQGLYVVGARVGEGDASGDLRDWRNGLGVFAVERFVEAEHLRKRTFEIPRTSRSTRYSTARSEFMSAILRTLAVWSSSSRPKKPILSPVAASRRSEGARGGAA